MRPTSRRGSGVGSALMKAAESALCKMGAERVHLHVTSNNAGSISFYEELGYTDRQTIMCRPLLVPARL